MSMRRFTGGSRSARSLALVGIAALFLAAPAARSDDPAPDPTPATTPAPDPAPPPTTTAKPKPKPKTTTAAKPKPATTRPTYTAPAYTPPAYTPPAYTPPAYTPPAVTTAKPAQAAKKKPAKPKKHATRPRVVLPVAPWHGKLLDPPFATPAAETPIEVAPAPSSGVGDTGRALLILLGAAGGLLLAAASVPPAVVHAERAQRTLIDARAPAAFAGLSLLATTALLLLLNRVANQ